MTYEVTLISANIRTSKDGEMVLALNHKGARAAEIEYRWDEKQFTAVFHGYAPTMPVPAHPTRFIADPIAAIAAVKTENHRFPTDVFSDNRIFITTEIKD